MKSNPIQKIALSEAAKTCAAVEGLPSCATCAHASPVSRGEGGSERNVYCRAVDYSERPNGLKVRRTSHCSLYKPDAVTVQCDIVACLRDAFGGWGIEIRARANGGKGARQ